MDDRPATPTASAYAANLQQTLKELRKKVQECEGQLSELRSRQLPIPQAPAGQIETLVAAFDDVANSEPFLPYPGSVLPALLALRKTHQTIAGSRAFLASQAAATEAQRRRHDAEGAALRDHELLRQALAERVGTLQAQAAAGPGSSEARADDEDAAAAAARERAEEMQEKKRHYKRETSRLMRALDRFINERLAAMLAAEELGGPVVGDLVDVDPEDLAAGFNAQGKRRRKPPPPPPPREDDKGDEKRQRRIDEIWGRPETARGDGGGQRQTDEVQAAAAEMRGLTEDLLNGLVEAGGNGSESYVRLQRESAAARFLIRSKVAEFHPKDAMRIRLVDFGRELED